jgi:hypothetical protein
VIEDALAGVQAARAAEIRYRLDSYPAVPCLAYFGHTIQVQIFSVDSNKSLTTDLHT